MGHSEACGSFGGGFGEKFAGSEYGRDALVQFMRVYMSGKRRGRGGRSGRFGMSFGDPRSRALRSYRRRGAGEVRSAVLLLLEEEPMHGYQLIQEIAGRSEGAWTPSPGSVYPTLQQLEDEGLVAIESAEGRKVVHLTEEGYAYVRENREKLVKVWDSAGDGSDNRILELRKLYGQLFEAVASVASEGDEVKSDRTAAILKEARKEIYRVLAEDGEDDTHGTPDTSQR